MLRFSNWIFFDCLLVCFFSVGWLSSVFPFVWIYLPRNVAGCYVISLLLDIFLPQRRCLHAVLLHAVTLSNQNQKRKKFVALERCSVVSYCFPTWTVCCRLMMNRPAYVDSYWLVPLLLFLFFMEFFFLDV